MKNSSVLISAILVLTSTATVSFAQTENYPNRVVRLIVPFPPGGGTDIIARTVAQKLTESWGQTVVVDNRAGANSIIGTDLVAKSKPDGYTLGMVIAQHVINPALYRKLPYNTATDFAPVTQMAHYPFILTSHPSVPAKNARELIALAKSRPGQLSYASSGNGSGPHLGMELFCSLAKIKLVHVPYKGAAPANTDLAAGQVQLMFNNFLAGMPLISAGKLRVLAVTSAQRSHVMPDVPTIAESALPGFAVTGWYALVAPAGTPPAIIGKIQQDVAAALRAPAINTRLKNEGAEPVGSTPAEFGKFIQNEMQQWAKVVRDTNLNQENF